MTSTEYPNCTGNSTGGARRVLPDRAFICCKDSASSIRQRLIEFDCSLVGLVVLSPLDNQALNSWDAVAVALPRSIRLLIIDDIEYLLPSDQRNPASVLRLIGRVRAFAAERGLYVSVSSVLDLLGELSHGGAR